MDLKAVLNKKAADTGQKAVEGVLVPAAVAPKAKSMKDLTASLNKAKEKDPAKGEVDVHFEVGPVPTWSFSGLKSHENCKQYTFLNKVEKIPQESGPAASRGSEIHDACELWVRGQRGDLPADNKTKFDAFSDQFVQLKKDFRDGKVSLEDKWGIRKDWSPCEWSDDEIWGKAALDGFVMENEHSCRIIDYKTGQKFGNEMKHADQGLCYALHAMHRYPDLDIFQVEFWYLDQGVTTVRMFNRRQLNILLPRYHSRGQQMTMTPPDGFTASANLHSCRFCSYGSNKNAKGKPYGNGACDSDIYKTLEE